MGEGEKIKEIIFYFLESWTGSLQGQVSARACAGEDRDHPSSRQSGGGNWPFPVPISCSSNEPAHEISSLSVQINPVEEPVFLHRLQVSHTKARACCTQLPWPEHWFHFFCLYLKGDGTGESSVHPARHLWYSPQLPLLIQIINPLFPRFLSLIPILLAYLPRKCWKTYFYIKHLLPSVPLVSIWLEKLAGCLCITHCLFAGCTTETWKSCIGSSLLIPSVAAMVPVPLGTSTLMGTSKNSSPLSITLVKQIAEWETAWGKWILFLDCNLRSKPHGPTTGFQMNTEELSTEELASHLLGMAILRCI